MPMSHDIQNKRRACFSRGRVVAAGGNTQNLSVKLKNVFSFGMVRWARARQPGDGSWAVISCTHEPLNNNAPWERQRRTTISRPTGATAAPTPLPESEDTHKNLERKALLNTSFSGEEAADLRDLCRRDGTSPVLLLLDPPRFCPNRPPAPLHTNHTGKHTSG